MSVEIDVSFTDTVIHADQGWPFNFTDTVKFNIENADTASWLFIQSAYTAAGGEKYIYIGSNTPNASIMCVDSLMGELTAAYYFIDNISVSGTRVSVDDVIVFNPAIFPNPASTFLHVNNLYETSNYSIIDGKGLSIAKGQLSKGSNTVDVSVLKNGLYFLQINQTHYRKIIIHH